VPDGPDGRRLVLAENADGGWRATLDRRPLRATTVDGWAQGFALPAEGGQLEVTHEAGARTGWLWLQGALAATVLILALPSARRRAVDLDEESEVEAAEPLPVVAMPPDDEVAEPQPRSSRRRKRGAVPSRRRRGERVTAEQWLNVPAEAPAEDSEPEIDEPEPYVADKPQPGLADAPESPRVLGQGPPGSIGSNRGTPDPTGPAVLELGPDLQETATLRPPPVVASVDDGSTYRPKRAARRHNERAKR
jgi:hypothetical protein